MPSVIVAKIMEKLREHERESCSVASPPHVSTNTDRNNRFSRVARNVLTTIKSPGNSVLTPDNRAWLDSQNQRSPEVSRKRIIIGQQSFTFSHDGDLIESFSPPSSLTDSDSRWTSSTGTQGQLKTDLCLDKPSFPSIQEAGEPSPPSPTSRLAPSSVPRHAFANIVTSLLAEKNQESKLLSSMEARSVGDSGLPSGGRSSRGLDEFDSPVNSPVTSAVAPVTVTVAHHLDSVETRLDIPTATDSPQVTEASNPNCESREIVLDNESSEDLNLSVKESLDSVHKESKSDDSLCGKQDCSLQNSPQTSNFEHNQESSEACDNKVENPCELGLSFNKANNFSELPFCNHSLTSDLCSDSFTESESNVLLENVSEELNTPDLSERPNVHPSPQSSKVMILSYTSPFPSLASELELIQSKEEGQHKEQWPVESIKTVDSETRREPQPVTSAPVRVIESLDKVIESLEKIMEPLEVITESELQMNSAIKSQSDKEKLLNNFEDLKTLARQLLEAGVPVEVGTPDHFLLLTVNERCELQCRVVRLALSSYQTQLSLDTSHYELKCCLGVEVTRLSDLLDTTSDPDKLNTLVRQMTELLKHQAELSSELAAWTSQSAEEKPGCHQLCEVVLRRLRALELLVHRNTRALSDLRNQVSH